LFDGRTFRHFFRGGFVAAGGSRFHFPYCCSS